MAEQDHIRNPVEWVWDEIAIVLQAVGSLGRSVRGSKESLAAPLPKICQIKASDLGEVLIRGLDDFKTYRTDIIGLVLMYPVIGVVLAWRIFGHEMLPLLFCRSCGGWGLPSSLFFWWWM
jgi:uncharacterized membrane protein